jgi:hypothetical protein
MQAAVVSFATVVGLKVLRRQGLGEETSGGLFESVARSFADGTHTSAREYYVAGGTAWNEFSANDRLAHSVRPRQIDYKRRVKGNEPMSLV